MERAMAPILILAGHSQFLYRLDHGENSRAPAAPERLMRERFSRILLERGRRRRRAHPLRPLSLKAPATTP